MINTQPTGFAEPTDLPKRLHSLWIKEADRLLEAVGPDAEDAEWQALIEMLEEASPMPGGKVAQVAAKARSMVGSYAEKADRRRLAVRAFRTAARVEARDAPQIGG
ncbi:hypothetical protein [Parvularcula dongshanensis]|uniref:Uncharacterized protein n=1 Tax=Parvularcula dongshanensis TaxID=1173995 RepID=A0A840I3F0_9PROT|nr:hypothetical protein [Parvularcula dongshanensis]MBB4658708.1 hypothetical protein [Parvularcula dongshanensis]